MSGWTNARAVEQEGMAEVFPYFQMERAYDGRIVTTDKGRLSEMLQKQAGDIILNDAKGRVWCIEFKVEKRTTGNLFLETWSNLSRYTPGWLMTLSSDYLLYYFLDTKDLHLINFPHLKAWCFQEKNIYHFREVCQKEHDQLNDTWGRIVPVKTIEAAMKDYKFTNLKDWLSRHQEAA